MNRRNFLIKGSLAFGAMGLSNNMFAKQFGVPNFMSTPAFSEDRILVMVRLEGGNDGLNTVIPFDQYGNLAIHRPTILPAENKLLSLDGYDNMKFNPKMTGMQRLFNNGELSVLQNVGSPGGLSHGRTMNVWESGIANRFDPATKTGWLGRVLDKEFPNFPYDLPSVTGQDPFAIYFRAGAVKTCQGESANFSYPMRDPNNGQKIGNSGGTTSGEANSYQGNHIAYIENMADQLNTYGSNVKNAYNMGNSVSKSYANNNISKQFRYIAKLISGGLKTKVYVIPHGNYDTHKKQAGNHDRLLNELSTGISAFQEDMHALNLNQRVLGMTYSEFGRKIRENGSKGTDHGRASSMFFFGSCVSNSVVGDNPIIHTDLQYSTLPKRLDYRDVYSTVLRDWFGVSEDDIKSNWESNYNVNFLDIFTTCAPLSTTDTPPTDIKPKLYPNPSNGELNIDLDIDKGNAYITIYDISGREVRKYERYIESSGANKINLTCNKLSSGTYFVRIKGKDTDKRIKFIMSR